MDKKKKKGTKNVPVVKVPLKQETLKPEVRGMIDGTPIYCKGDLVPIDSLHPNLRNHNKHPERQIKLLAKVIHAHGWRVPITVSTRSGMIVRGHCRWMAAKELGMSQVPVDYQYYASEEAELADLVADKRIPELAETDKSLLRGILKDIKASDFDVELTGYSGIDVEQLIQDIALPDGDDVDPDQEGGGGTGGNEGQSQINEANTQATIGAYRFEIQRDQYQEWLEEIRQTVGFDEESIVNELKRRLRLL